MSTDLIAPEIEPKALAPSDTGEPETTPTRSRALKYQIDTLAKMAAQCISPEVMSKVTGLSEDTIKRITRGKQSKAFDAALDGYREQECRLMFGHRYQMIGFLPKVYAAIEASLDSSDEKAATESAFKILRELIPLPVASREKGDDSSTNINVFAQSETLQTRISHTINDLGGMLGGIQEAISNQIPNQHIFDGAAALPSPVTKMDVSEGEALPEPTEPEDPSEFTVQKDPTDGD